MPRLAPVLFVAPLVLFGALCGGAPEAQDPSEEVIVFTANQVFMSRIYLLHMDGSVITWFHYDPYRFVDLEVVNNELYASEAFAPRVLKVDLYTGELDVIVDDWSLYYFYGLAFDGTYWYLDEWDLNRYEFDGTKDGGSHCLGVDRPLRAQAVRNPESLARRGGALPPDHDARRASCA